jgi:hypothetical protein
MVYVAYCSEIFFSKKYFGEFAATTGLKRVNLRIPFIEAPSTGFKPTQTRPFSETHPVQIHSTTSGS